MILNLTHECDNCATEMHHKIASLDSKNNVIDFPVIFCSQLEWECPKCGLKHFTGDIEVLNEKQL
jgi:hypothetical protein